MLTERHSVDTQAMELCLPAEKIERLRATIHSLREKRTCTQQELESLIGLLGPACKVLRPGC